jgi:N-acetylglucosamine-6-phosphate deacetylase
MASTYPAEAIGVTTKGKLEAGFDADIVLLRSDLSMHSTWIGGKPVFTAADIRRA